MASSPATPPIRTSPPLRRDPGRRVLAGVCAGLAARLGVDPLLVRFGFVAAAMAGGIGIGLYLLAWAAIPADARAAPAVRRPPGSGRGSLEIALGTGLLLLSVLLSFRELGLWFSDAIAWPLVLVAAGGALLWGRSGAEEPAESAAVDRAAPRAPEAGRAPAATRPSAKTVRHRAALVSRASVGVALVIAAGLAFLQATGALSTARDVVLAVLVAVVVLGVIFAPFFVRLARSLTAERAERIRSQERAEMAAHLHDSVLQTLAMIQRRADDPAAVAALTRRQERELRSWLSNRSATGNGGGGRFAAALTDAGQEIEEAEGVAVEVLAVGDAELDEDAEALVAAAREAMLNAAKFAGTQVNVYAEASATQIQVFVRDRGPGFEPGSIPPDRRGVRESIVGRMERHGGSARITSSPGAGTELELVLERGAL